MAVTSCSVLQCARQSRRGHSLWAACVCVRAHKAVGGRAGEQNCVASSPSLDCKSELPAACARTGERHRRMECRSAPHHLSEMRLPVRVRARARRACARMCSRTVSYLAHIHSPVRARERERARYCNSAVVCVCVSSNWLSGWPALLVLATLVCVRSLARINAALRRAHVCVCVCVRKH